MAVIPKVENRPGIYIIRHNPSGSTYVGQTKRMASRWNQHLKDLREGRHGNRQLQALWSRDPDYHFEFQVIKYAPAGMSALARQRWLVAEERAFYNTMKDTRFCLNGMVPAIVATDDAVEEYRKEKARKDKESDAAVSTHRKQLKEKWTYLESLIAKRLPPIHAMEAEVRERETRIKESTGWKAFFLGKPAGFNLEAERQVIARLSHDISSLRKEVDPILAEIQKLKREYDQALNLFTKFDKRRTREMHRRWGIPYQEPKIR